MQLVFSLLHGHSIRQSLAPPPTLFLRGWCDGASSVQPSAFLFDGTRFAEIEEHNDHHQIHPSPPPPPPSPPTPPTPPHSFVHWIWFSPPPQHENRHKEKDSSRDRRLSAVAAAVARDNKHGTNHNPLLAHPHGSSHIHTLIAYDVDISMPPSRSRT